MYLATVQSLSLYLILLQTLEQYDIGSVADSHMVRHRKRAIIRAFSDAGQTQKLEISSFLNKFNESKRFSFKGADPDRLACCKRRPFRLTVLLSDTDRLSGQLLKLSPVLTENRFMRLLCVRCPLGLIMRSVGPFSSLFGCTFFCWMVGGQ